jgi:hypothetical protein
MKFRQWVSAFVTWLCVLLWLGLFGRSIYSAYAGDGHARRWMALAFAVPLGVVLVMVLKNLREATAPGFRAAFAWCAAWGAVWVALTLLLVHHYSDAVMQAWNLVPISALGGATAITIWRGHVARQAESRQVSGDQP